MLKTRQLHTVYVAYFDRGLTSGLYRPPAVARRRVENAAFTPPDSSRRRWCILPIRPIFPLKVCHFPWERSGPHLIHGSYRPIRLTTPNETTSRSNLPSFLTDTVVTNRHGPVASRLRRAAWIGRCDEMRRRTWAAVAIQYCMHTYLSDVGVDDDLLLRHVEHGADARHVVGDLVVQLQTLLRQLPLVLVHRHQRRVQLLELGAKLLQPQFARHLGQRLRLRHDKLLSIVAILAL